MWKRACLLLFLLTNQRTQTLECDETLGSVCKGLGGEIFGRRCVYVTKEDFWTHYAGTAALCLQDQSALRQDVVGGAAVVDDEALADFLFRRVGPMVQANIVNGSGPAVDWRWAVLTGLVWVRGVGLAWFSPQPRPRMARLDLTNATAFLRRAPAHFTQYKRECGTHLYGRVEWVGGRLRTVFRSFFHYPYLAPVGAVSLCEFRLGDGMEWDSHAIDRAPPKDRLEERCDTLGGFLLEPQRRCVFISTGKGPAWAAAERCEEDGGSTAPLDWSTLLAAASLSSASPYAHTGARLDWSAGMEVLTVEELWSRSWSGHASVEPVATYFARDVEGRAFGNSTTCLMVESFPQLRPTFCEGEARPSLCQLSAEDRPANSSWTPPPKEVLVQGDFVVSDGDVTICVSRARPAWPPLSRCAHEALGLMSRVYRETLSPDQAMATWLGEALAQTPVLLACFLMFSITLVANAFCLLAFRRQAAKRQVVFTLQRAIVQCDSALTVAGFIYLLYTVLLGGAQYSALRALIAPLSPRTLGWLFSFAVTLCPGLFYGLQLSASALLTLSTVERILGLHPRTRLWYNAHSTAQWQRRKTVLASLVVLACVSLALGTCGEGRIRFLAPPPNSLWQRCLVQWSFSYAPLYSLFNVALTLAQAPLIATLITVFRASEREARRRQARLSKRWREANSLRPIAGKKLTVVLVAEFSLNFVSQLSFEGTRFVCDEWGSAVPLSEELCSMGVFVAPLTFSIGLASSFVFFLVISGSFRREVWSGLPGPLRRCLPAPASAQPRALRLSTRQ